MGKSKNLKISTTVWSCIGLRNTFEKFFVIKNMNDEYKEFCTKILQKLNNAILKQDKHHVNLMFTERQATILQSFVMEYLDNPKLKNSKPVWINKDDIFKPFELIGMT
jgi:hypothetical protein